MTTTTLPDGRTAQLWLGGAGQGPVVVFLHGCPDTRHAAMTGEAAARASGVRLLCVNRPGYGHSTYHASDPGTVADDVVAVLDQIGIGRIGVLAMSIGGGYGVSLAARHPDRVQVLGLVSTQYRQEPGSVEEAMEAARPDFEAWVATIRPGDPDDTALAARWRASLPEPDAALLADTPDAEVAAAAREALAQHEGFLRDAALAFRPWPHLPEDVRCPAYAWSGELDGNAPAADTARLASRLGAQHFVRPGTTHLAALLGHWQDLLATLRPHLD